MRIEEQVMGNEAAWHQYGQEVAQQILDDERGALRLVSKGLGGMKEARLLARSLGHFDLFGEHNESL